MSSDGVELRNNFGRYQLLVEENAGLLGNRALSGLPIDCLGVICSTLTSNEVLSFSRTCREIRSVRATAEIDLRILLERSAGQFFLYARDHFQTDVSRFEGKITFLISQLTLSNAKQIKGQIHTVFLELFLILTDEDITHTENVNEFSFPHLKGEILLALAIDSWVREARRSEDHTPSFIRIFYALFEQNLWEDVLKIGEIVIFNMEEGGIKQFLLLHIFPRLYVKLLAKNRLKEAFYFTQHILQRSHRNKYQAQILGEFLSRNRFSEALNLANSIPQENNGFKSLALSEISRVLTAQKLYEEAKAVANLMHSRYRKIKVLDYIDSQIAYQKYPFLKFYDSLHFRAWWICIFRGSRCVSLINVRSVQRYEDSTYFMTREELHAALPLFLRSAINEFVS